MQFSLEQIDRFLARADEARSDPELREIFASFSVEYDCEVPGDPFSGEYRERQLALYHALAGKAYTPENEVSHFDVTTCSVNPFPYCNGSAELVGNQLLAIGFLIKAMNLPVGSRILEFGPGWGNTTLQLAKMGYRVTAIDIEQNFVDLIAERAQMESLDIKVIQGDFSLIETMSEQFDAILFFECFHHCADHLRLIASFEKRLAPGGIVCLAAEPIEREFPVPWGLRMDGESLWAIRKHGWMELGFRRGYFEEALARYGFAGIDHTGADGPWSKAIIAHRQSELGRQYQFRQGELISTVGRRIGSGVELVGDESGFAAFGPYDCLKRGQWRAHVELGEGRREGTLIVDVADKRGSVIIMRPVDVHLETDAPNPSVDFATLEDLSEFEFRIVVRGGVKAKIQGVRLEFIGQAPNGRPLKSPAATGSLLKRFGRSWKRRIGCA